MKLFIIVTALLLIAGSIIFCSYSSSNKIIEQKLAEDSPQEPYEDFMLQRTYPNKKFDIKAYQSALNSAVSQNKHPQQRRSNSLNWTLEGPGNIGGRFNCITLNPLNPFVMYAGSANGGVWKTTDNGSSWYPIFDSIPYLAISAITINPNDTSEIWVGTGDLNISGTMYLGNGVYKSNNAGNSWNYLGLSDSYVISGIIFNPNNTNEVLVSAMGNSFAKDNKRGMYRTSNSGLTFTQTKYINDSTGFIDMVQNPVNPSIIYASSFSRIRTESTSLINGTEVYVYKSTDFGQTWNILSGGLPNGASHERLGITICKSSPNILYALYSTSDLTNPELYKTTDGGATWSLISFIQFDLNLYGSYGWYFGKIYVDPNDPNTLFIPGVFLQYSIDGGINWNLITAATSTDVHADGHYMNFLSSSDFIFCTDGGLYRTTDGGVNWADIENIPNNQFYAVTENKNNNGEYAGGVQDNGTMYGNASVINNFTRLAGGDGFTVAYTSNPFLLYTETQYGNIIYDDNFPNGFWNSIITDNSQNYNWHTPYFLSSFGEDTLFFAGQKVMRIDGAPYGNYTEISPVLNDPNSSWRVSNISTINQSKLNRNILYAGTADGKVWNTLDGGNFWNDITPFQGSSYYVTRVMPSPNDAATAYVTRSGYRSNDNTPLVFKSTNNGTAWTNISGDLPLLAVNDIVIYPGHENIIFIANDAGVYVTTNFGINWERLGDNMPYLAVLDIALNFNNQKIIAGTFGRSMYTIDIASIVSGIPAINNDLSFEIFPNPASDLINIKTNSKTEDVSIYSTDGAIVTKSNSKSVDVSNLPAGIYFVKISAGEIKIIRKFLKI